MPRNYDPRELDRKWQERWEGDGLYRVREKGAPSSQLAPLRGEEGRAADAATPHPHLPPQGGKGQAPKWFALTMFPYTSGDLHIGHWYAETPADVHARFMRMRGQHVLRPIGFDAFGLPAENAAIKRNIHPFTWTMKNVETMRAQLKTIGCMYDWSREVVTCLPDYYMWNQYFFLQFYKKGLAYKRLAPVNWCENDQTSLAREQVLPNGTCERCGGVVRQKDLEQWFFRVTEYADELLDFSKIEWPEKIKLMQTNWIGRSEGAEIGFGLEDTPHPNPLPSRFEDSSGSATRGKGQEGGQARPPSSPSPAAGEGTGQEIRVFTTRADTVYGVTFMVLAPEHPLVPGLTTPENRAAVEAYIEQARRQTEIERMSTEHEKTGVRLGSYCINRLTGERVPILIGDYVLAGYGTGAVMGVPAHDQRDFEFAQKYGLPIKVVVAPPGWDEKPFTQAWEDEGTMVNSGPFNGLPSAEGKKKVTEYIAQKGWGKGTVNYRIRDWLISRQRYWGTPIPVIYCPDHGAVPVPERDLPVLLPEDAEFRPTGESPLVLHQGFLNTPCPECGKPSKRETDTMDTFVDSSWYFLRYTSPESGAKAPFDPAKVDKWCPVDMYTGGAEHAVMHLLYARFFTKALRDLGYLGFDEPFTRLFNQGIILGEDHQKMSKSRGNVVNPDAHVTSLGADAVRVFLMFVGPWDMGGSWSDTGIQGVSRWLDRVWDLAVDRDPTTLPETGDEKATDELRRTMHKAIERVTKELQAMQFNTMIAGLMEYTNALSKAWESKPSRSAWNSAIEALIMMLAPSAPHLAEELWERTGRTYSVHMQAWPTFDPALTQEVEATLVVQVNGKVRDRIPVAASISEVRARELGLGSEKVRPFTEGKAVEKVLYVPHRYLLNVVVK